MLGEHKRRDSLLGWGEREESFIKGVREDDF